MVTRELSQLWLRQWLVAWRHQAITWTNVNLSSVTFSDIHLRALPSENLETNQYNKIENYILKSHPDLLGANELTIRKSWRHDKMLLVSLVADALALKYHTINSLWPGDTIWHHRICSTPVQIMACCLALPGHYLNQHWWIISKALWHLLLGNFSGNPQDIYPWYEFEN